MWLKSTILFLVLMAYSTLHAQVSEKILLETDKQWYYPGEPIWFGLNVLDACNGHLSSSSKVAYVELVDSENKPVYQTSVSLHDAHGDGSLAISDAISTGTYHLVAYTNWMKNFGASVYAHRLVQIVNPVKPGRVAKTAEAAATKSDFDVGIQIPQTVYNTRDRIPISISTDKGYRVSVSVFRVDDLQTNNNIGFGSSDADPCGLPAKQNVKSLMENRGHIVKARVTDKRSQQPVSGIRTYLSVVQTPNKIYVATSDSTGNVYFEVDELSGRGELVMQTNRSADSNYVVEVIQPYVNEKPTTTLAATTDVLTGASSAIDDALFSAQVQKIFHAPAPASKMKEADTLPFYGKPDAFYLMSDYQHFSTVEEILREYVTTVGVQRRRGKLQPIVYDILSGNRPFNDPPLILINGVPEFDHSHFMEMNTDEFESIAVMAHKYVIGHQVFHGIIDVKLNVPLRNFGRNVTVADYSGPAINAEFNFPVYDNEAARNSKIPDFRNVLYWRSSLPVNRQGKSFVQFYASDLEGEYAIVVRAVSADGKVGYATTKIQIR